MVQKLKFKNEALRCRAHAAVLQEQVDRPNRYHLTKQFAFDIEAIRARARRSPEELDAEAAEAALLDLEGQPKDKIDGLRTFADQASGARAKLPILDSVEGIKSKVYGESDTVPDDLHGLLIRRNLTLMDESSGRPLLQRFGARRRHQQYDLNDEIREGRQRLDAVIQTAEARKTPDTRITFAQPDHHYHFGVWYGIGCQHPTPCPDTKQDKGSHEAQRNVLRFMFWLEAFVQDHVEPLIDLTDSSDEGNFAMEPFFRTRLLKRSEDYDWFCTEVPLAKELSQPLYNASSPFVGYSGMPHADTRDATPTILLNFGFTRLHLPEYSATVDLAPGEIIFFDNKLVHYTTKHPGYAGYPDADRWAVSCFFQSQIHKRKRARRKAKQLQALQCNAPLVRSESVHSRRQLRAQLRKHRREDAQKGRQNNRN